MTNKMLNCIAGVFICTIFFCACGKNPSISNDGIIQQGDTTIEINAAYSFNPYYMGAMPYPALRVRYNNVIASPINLTISFYLQSGQVKDVPMVIPANNKSLQGQGDEYINNWTNSGTVYDSTTGTNIVLFDNFNWGINSVKIKSVSCPDKHYGFKVLNDTSWTAYYHPTDSITTVSFFANSDSVYYSDYDFNTVGTWFNTANSTYSFTPFILFNAFLYFESVPSTYPLWQGMIIDIPYLLYLWNNQVYGIEPTVVPNPSDYSSVKLTITSIHSPFFDATFSGKIYSSRQPDTLVITKGIFHNAPLPIVQ